MFQKLNQLTLKSIVVARQNGGVSQASLTESTVIEVDRERSAGLCLHQRDTTDLVEVGRVGPD